MFRCYCTANLKECDFKNPLCPASTKRLENDKHAAISELYQFCEWDEIMDNQEG